MTEIIESAKIEIFKLKEIYENLKESVDKCQDVADVVEDAALK